MFRPVRCADPVIRPCREYRQSRPAGPHPRHDGRCRCFPGSCVWNRYCRKSFPLFRDYDDSFQDPCRAVFPPRSRPAHPDWHSVRYPTVHSWPKNSRTAPDIPFPSVRPSPWKPRRSRWRPIAVRVWPVRRGFRPECSHRPARPFCDARSGSRNCSFPNNCPSAHWKWHRPRFHCHERFCESGPRLPSARADSHPRVESASGHPHCPAWHRTECLRCDCLCGQIRRCPCCLLCALCRQGSRAAVSFARLCVLNKWLSTQGGVSGEYV